MKIIYEIKNVDKIRFLIGTRKKMDLKISFRLKPFDIRKSINNSVMYQLRRFSKSLPIY